MCWEAVNYVRLGGYSQQKRLTIVMNCSINAVSCIGGGWKGTSSYKAASANSDFLTFSVFCATNFLVTAIIRT